ncbi:EsaB/YukD family protein [Paenibacillus marinisediminis]
MLVTFHAGERVQAELKVPEYVKICDLLAMLSETFNLPIQSDSRLQAEPLGRILDGNLTLKEEGVLHGALLTLI